MTKSTAESPVHARTPREVWFESAGARLFALERGEGPPVVFLHGGLADHRASLLRVGPLDASHRILVPDLRGSGRSIHRGELGWDQLADDVLALLDHLGHERAIIGGVSAGSAVALRFALRHPHRTRGVLLLAPVFAGRERGLNDAQRQAFRAMADVGRRVLVDGAEVLRPLYERLPPPTRELALEMMRGFDPASVAATTHFLASGAQPFDDVRDLASIDAPVLLVPGTDPEHPADVCDLYAQHLRQRVVVDAHDEFATRLEAFCRALAA